ncbi:hypothetical protein IAD21_02123 [Abditibacteriota bacterium]|nr:hypothetical protein IAD21_02123 [Abditibacteriota bacterium]
MVKRLLVGRSLFGISPMKHLFLFGSLTLMTAAVCAAPSPQSGLGFDVTTRISASGQNQLTPQTIQAHIVVSGSKARIETRGASSRAVVLYTPPFVYRLLPAEKAGVKWKMSGARGNAFGGFDPQQLLRNPSKMRAALLQFGAKRTGTTVLNGVPVEIFDVARPGQRFSKVRAWMRLSDSLPVRLEATSGGLKVVASWSKYTKLSNVSGSQFAPPKGFAIRESQNPPVLSLL